ncbi:MAG: hypothetical protein M1832_002084 [Thelocarpon impressellum]|nr:MAG: hypothetical protein M1832_002084 [Thelocarpon impressellum]
MANLNLSTNGPSITKSYQSIVAPAAAAPASSSPTYAKWAVFSVSAPLANAFQQDAGGKESTLKVQSTGDGELADLIEEFSDGRIQFAFVRVKDPNTALPKYVLIGWCGEGVPERTKGYFTSHLAAVSNTLRGYHVQVTARSDRDLTPEGIVQKVSEASGSKYSGGSASTSSAAGPPPPIASKPAFTPTRTGGGGSGFNPLAGNRTRPGAPKDTNVDRDGWGSDAPPVTRTQLEKVQSAYNPTKVNMAELTKQKPEPSRYNDARADTRNDSGDVVKGGYQPVGKVDIAALRRQSQEQSSARDDRPTTVKGAYEPVGKVDIAAIRARAQPRPSDGAAPSVAQAPPPTTASASFVPQSERLTSLPKPRVANKFGSGAGSFTGTKAPTPGGVGLESKPSQAVPAVGTASRTFADEGGKTPAQIWAEKKARERGVSGAGDQPPPAGYGGPTSPITSQKSGGEWKSQYAGKSWAPVATTATGRSASSSLGQQRTGHDEEPQEEASASPAGGVGALRDRFKGAVPMGAPSFPKSPTEDESTHGPPPLDVSSKPNAAPAIPGLPTRSRHPADENEEKQQPLPTPPVVPRSPTPPTPPTMRDESPIRIAMPVGRSQQAEIQAPEERFGPEPVPIESLAKAAPHEDELTDEPAGHDPARAAGQAAAATTFGDGVAAAGPAAGKRALVQYDYEKAEDNELELKEGEYVTNIDMVDEDWWMGQNSRGEVGLFPSNYVELVEDENEGVATHAAPTAPPSAPVPVESAPTAGPTSGAAGASTTLKGPSATALYDYEAAEDNELSFAEGSKITGLEFPDEDWWFGHFGGKTGLFPSNYVEINE